MKGCAFCGSAGALVLEEGPDGAAMECAACGARGPGAESEVSAVRLYLHRPRERQEWLHGLAVGLAAGSTAVAVILGAFVHRARADLVREIDAAWELSAAVEARAFDRGLASARALREGAALGGADAE